MTIAHLLALDVKPVGRQTGRVLTESLVGGRTQTVKRSRLVSEPAANGLRTVIDVQTVEGRVYLGAGGFPGRTLGLSD
jgi:hypothetical protein